MKNTNLFFWGFLKNYVYNLKIQSPVHLKERIREVPNQVSREKLQRAEEVEYWLDIGRTTNPALPENCKLRCKLLDLLRTSHFRFIAQITQKSEILGYFGAKD